MKLFLIVLLTATQTVHAQADRSKNQKKCYPYCGRYSLEKLKELDLSSLLPRDPDLYKFRVKGTYRGETYFKQRVPVYQQKSDGLFTFQDYVNVGKKVKLERLANIQHRMFYRVTIRQELGKDVKGWLDGRFIEGYDFNENASLNIYKDGRDE